MGLLLNASRPIEATTPFFLWRAIFERLFTTATLRELARRSTAYGKEQANHARQGTTGNGNTVGGIGAGQGGNSAGCATERGERNGGIAEREESSAPLSASEFRQYSSERLEERNRSSSATPRAGGGGLGAENNSSSPSNVPPDRSPALSSRRAARRVRGEVSSSSSAVGLGGLTGIILPGGKRRGNRSPDFPSGTASAPNSPAARRDSHGFFSFGRSGDRGGGDRDSVGSPSRPSTTSPYRKRGLVQPGPLGGRGCSGLGLSGGPSASSSRSLLSGGASAAAAIGGCTSSLFLTSGGLPLSGAVSAAACGADVAVVVDGGGVSGDGRMITPRFPSAAAVHTGAAPVHTGVLAVTPCGVKTPSPTAAYPSRYCISPSSSSSGLGTLLHGNSPPPLPPPPHAGWSFSSSPNFPTGGLPKVQDELSGLMLDTDDGRGVADVADVAGGGGGGGDGGGGAGGGADGGGCDGGGGGGEGGGGEGADIVPDELPPSPPASPTFGREPYGSPPRPLLVSTGEDSRTTPTWLRPPEPNQNNTSVSKSPKRVNPSTGEESRATPKWLRPPGPNNAPVSKSPKRPFPFSRGRFNTPHAARPSVASTVAPAASAPTPRESMPQRDGSLSHFSSLGVSRAGSSSSKWSSHSGSRTASVSSSLHGSANTLSGVLAIDPFGPGPASVQQAPSHTPASTPRSPERTRNPASTPRSPTRNPASTPRSPAAPPRSPAATPRSPSGPGGSGLGSLFGGLFGLNKPSSFVWGESFTDRCDSHLSLHGSDRMQSARLETERVALQQQHAGYQVCIPNSYKYANALLFPRGSVGGSKEPDTRGLTGLY